MTKYIVSLLIAVISFLAISTSVKADTLMCNHKCEVDSDCGSGYACYVGVCRLNACPAVSTCVCTAETKTATPSPKVTTKPTATPKATATIVPNPTPVATRSAILKKTPTTGVNAWVLAGIAITMFVIGTRLSYFSA